MTRVLEPAGIIQAWGDLNDPRQRGRTIIDSLMNTPLLFWASEISRRRPLRRRGPPAHRPAARAHPAPGRHHLPHLLLGPDTGEPLRGETEQGSADDSCWARGQAWGIYGFTLNYRYTGDASLLDAAPALRRLLPRPPARRPRRRTGISCSPTAAARSGTARPPPSPSAACSNWPTARPTRPARRAYRRRGRTILRSLIDNYSTAGHPGSNALILHGVYDKPKSVGVDEGNLWGDYFYLEALTRAIRPGWTLRSPGDRARIREVTMDYRYHCSIPAADGRNTLPFNPCRLLDFTLLRLRPAQSWSGESGDREILAVILGGTASFTVGDQQVPGVGGRAGRVLRQAALGLHPGRRHGDGRGGRRRWRSPCPARRATWPPTRTSSSRRRSRPAAGARPTSAATTTRSSPRSSQPDLPARRLIVGETYTPSGNWSTYPPHRHTVDDLPAEAAHEEMYYFRVNPRDGFGISRVYTDEGYEENFTVRDHGMQMMPEGYHTVVSAPGYTTYYLWVLAGTQRTQGALEDVDLGLGRPHRADAARARALSDDPGQLPAGRPGRAGHRRQPRPRPGLRGRAGRGRRRRRAARPHRPGRDDGARRGARPAGGLRAVRPGHGRPGRARRRRRRRRGRARPAGHPGEQRRHHPPRAGRRRHRRPTGTTCCAVNLDAVFHLCQAAGRIMVAQGGGKIINIASMLSFQGGIRVPAYTAAKHAVVGLTKALANEWAGHGVNVNAIAPGYMATDNTAALRDDPDRAARHPRPHPRRPVGHPERPRGRGGLPGLRRRPVRARRGDARRRRLARPMTETETDKLIVHAPPPQQQRHEAIVALVTQRQYITVADAKAVTGASLSTVRRDLDDLDRAGALQRIHGGATAATTTDLAELRHYVARVAQVLAAGNVDAAHHLLVRTLAAFERLRSDRSHR